MTRYHIDKSGTGRYIIAERQCIPVHVHTTLCRHPYAKIENQAKALQITSKPERITVYAKNFCYETEDSISQTIQRFTRLSADDVILDNMYGTEMTS